MGELTRAVVREVGTLPLRLAVGAIAFYHGAMTFGIFASHGAADGVKAYADRLASSGVAPAVPLAWTFTVFAFVGGAFLILGLGTRPAAVAVGLVAAVAFVFGPPALVPSDILAGAVPERTEIAVLAFAGCTTLLARGGGAVSLDEVIARRRARAASGSARS